jgi:hypothetical protein
MDVVRQHDRRTTSWVILFLQADHADCYVSLSLENPLETVFACVRLLLNPSELAR